ncbi:hypothetical protein [Microbacterium gorillae]|uniref:hypothetical protein n=1 Tax=Microbacterium gorillae TaxID=1231063 RepID=UPI000590A2D6|nr:hypothetical protein [Microbacterium gorillae]
MVTGGAQSIATVAPAPWLPNGGRADVLVLPSPPDPMCLVRLLILRDRSAFCVPREDTASLDLPTRAVPGEDARGERTIRALADEVLGPRGMVRFLGVVRNEVAVGTPDYPWPTPYAHFGVWRAADAPIIGGEWVAVDDARSPLARKHWYPLALHALAG